MMEDLFEDAIGFIGETLTSGSYDIWRPDYASRNTDDMRVGLNVAIRVDPSRANPEPKVAGVEYYYVAIRASLVEPGDILVPNETQIGIPIITIQNKNTSLKDVCAYRTNRLGKITRSVRAEQAIYDNIPYDIVNTISPEEALNAGFDGSQNYEIRKLVMFSRSGERIRKGMHFTDLDTNVSYEMRSVFQHGPTTTILVSEK